MVFKKQVYITEKAIMLLTINDRAPFHKKS